MSQATEAYLARAAATGSVAVVPNDSADVAWARARSFFALPRVGLAIATDDLLQSPKILRVYQVQRSTRADSVRFAVTVTGGPRAENERYATILAHYIRTGELDRWFVL